MDGIAVTALAAARDSWGCTSTTCTCKATSTLALIDFHFPVHDHASVYASSLARSTFACTCMHSWLQIT